MAENKFSQIAKMFDLELEEVFHIKNMIAPCKFTPEGLVFQNGLGGWVYGRMFEHQLLEGELEIIMPPYRPNRGDRYFSYADFSWDIRCFGWDNLPLDYARLEAGMVFRTYDEARKELPSIYKKATGKDW